MPDLAPFTELVTLTSAGPDSFIAPPAPDKGERLYGGQFLAQCLTAALRTVNADRLVHSLHACFLRPGDVDVPLDITVERLRDGRSFSSRAVTAEQRGRRLFQMLVSLQVPAATPEYQIAGLPAVPDPESVATTYNDFTLAQTGAADWPGATRPMDIRYVNPPDRPRGEPITEPQCLWMRVPEALPADPGVHAVALAYLSDATLVDNIMLPLGLRWQDADFLGTSLDHAMWWHRPARADQWLLFEQRAEATGGGRGLASGRFFARDGTLVATCLQEGLMRWDGGATAR